MLSAYEKIKNALNKDQETYLITNEYTRAAWALLEAMRRNMAILENDAEGMQRLMRAFAIEICSQQPYNDRIVVGNSVLIEFPTAATKHTPTFANKADYLSYHSRDTVWGEDALLFPALAALGYQPVMHLAETHFPPYVPFTQQASQHPIRMDIVNYGAKSGGTHWELKGHSNAGGGNCMYHTIAQQVQKNITAVTAKLPENLVKETQAILQAPEVTNQAPPLAIKSQPKVQEDNKVTEEIKKQFQYLDKTAQQRQIEVENKLSVLSTEKLAALYRIARSNDGDYLNGRLNHIAKEHGVNPDDTNNFIRQAVDKSCIDPNLEVVIQEELLHALSVEAWRSEKAYQAIMSVDTAKLTISTTASTKDSNNDAVKHTDSPALRFKPPKLVK